METLRSIYAQFEFNERVFIAIIKLSVREQNWEFLTGEGIEKLGEELNISSNICILIRERLRKMKKMGTKSYNL
jgi:hypothetical protein